MRTSKLRVDFRVLGDGSQGLSFEDVKQRDHAMAVETRGDLKTQTLDGSFVNKVGDFPGQEKEVEVVVGMCKHKAAKGALHSNEP